MPKISIIIFLLELNIQLGLIGNNLSLFSGIDLLSSLSDIPSSGYGSGIINQIINANIINVLKNLLLLSSLLSLLLGTIVGLAQSRIKRLLAYSTISHIGFILLALAINTEQSIDSLIFYIIQYSITNLNTFLIIIAFGYIIKNTNFIKTNLKLSSFLHHKESDQDINFISELKGQFFLNPILSFSLSICLFSMAGIM